MITPIIQNYYHFFCFLDFTTTFLKLSSGYSYSELLIETSLEFLGCGFDFYLLLKLEVSGFSFTLVSNFFYSFLDLLLCYCLAGCISSSSYD